MMSDPFTDKHAKDAQAAKRKAIEDDIKQHKATIVQRIADRKKPVFNDLPHYKPRDPFKLGVA